MQVDFEEEKAQNSFTGQTNVSLPSLVRFVVKLGLAKNEKTANRILLGVTITAFIATIFVIFS